MHWVSDVVAVALNKISQNVVAASCNSFTVSNSNSYPVLISPCS